MRFSLARLRHRLPSFSALATATLLISFSSVATYAQSDSDGVITNPTHSQQPASYCTGDIAAMTQHAQYVSTRRYEIDCIMTELKQYQQASLDPNTQYTAFKAQAWLSYAAAEDSESSLSPAGTAAWQQGTSLLQGLREQQYESLNSAVSIPSYSTLLRADLWATLLALKQNGAMSLAPRELAFSEVKLIWAAAEECELDWRHSREHFDAAERWLRQAKIAYVNNDGTKLATLQADEAHLRTKLIPLISSPGQCQGTHLAMS